MGGAMGSALTGTTSSTSWISSSVSATTAGGSGRKRLGAELGSPLLRRLGLDSLLDSDLDFGCEFELDELF